jgi:hypothetical protein
MKMLSLTYGCATTAPITLDTPGGMSSTQPYDVNTCGFTCEFFYGGNFQGGCSDCGPGYGANLAPGATVDVMWDRRVYAAHDADPQCVGGMTGIQCALGQALAPASAQAGTLAVCPQAQGTAGYCGTSTYNVSFTVDTTQSQGTVEVQ